MPSKKQYWKNPEKYRAEMRAYAKANPDWKREAGREWMAKKRATDPTQRERDRAASKERFHKDPEAAYARMRDWVSRNPAIYLFYNARQRAKKYGIPFDLEKSDIVIPEFCPVLGLRIDPAGTGRRGMHPNSPSVDRVVPELGYVKSNIEVICMRANLIKRDATAEELRKLADYIDRKVAAAKAVTP